METMKRLLMPAIVTLAVVGCDHGSGEFTVSDLTADEARFVERYVVLERARMLLLADASAGEAVLDSLAAAWGDSAAVDALSWLPAHPARAAKVHDLLRRILEAENDSLTFAPHADRLDAPLPAPLPPD
jgi:hypothetical protein